MVIQVIARLWAELGEDPDYLHWVGHDALPAHLPSPLPVGALATAVVRVAAAQAVLSLPAPGPAHRTSPRPTAPGDPATSSALAGPVDPGDLPRLLTDPDRVAVSFRSERHFRWNGRPARPWAPLSGFFPVADGWVRTHANYPHHRARLLALTGLDQGAGPEDLTRVLSGRRARAWEDDAADAGALVLAVRTPARWAAHPQARAVAAAPLLTRRTLETAGPRGRRPEAGLPLAGVRVLDLTRVVAGPVATRTLAYLGAEVLRVDPPGVPEIPAQHLDTGQAKWSACLDLRDRLDRAVLENLLTGADILVTGYRPGALERFGLGPQDLAQRHPGLLVGRISAWGATGPWARRRGFDSLVQAASGIAVACADPPAAAAASDAGPQAAVPGVLPAQALDHSAGYLLVAGLLRELRRRDLDGRGAHVEVSLAAMAQLLLAMGPTPRPLPDPEPGGHLVDSVGPAGRLSVAAPAFTWAGGPADYPFPARPWAGDEPVWSPRGTV